MGFTIHNGVLLLTFLIALLLGAIVNKTNFCTMGAVSDWVHMGDQGRMRAWAFAVAIALLGVIILEAVGKIGLAPTDTFPPYRSASFAWLRYLLGGMLFGIGMTLGSGCGLKTCVRIGGGNLKSVVVMIVTAVAAYALLWTELFETLFMGWISPTVVDLSTFGIPNQELGAILAKMSGGDARLLHYIIGGLVVVALFTYAFKAADFRANRDNVFAGLIVGLAVVAGWYVTAGPMGEAWKNFADMATDVPSRVQSQSYTFISPMGDLIRYMQEPAHLQLVNFGIMALAGVIVGSLLYATMSGKFRLEWFPSFKDCASHVSGGALMGVGGVLGMGCTIGQGVTGASTLAAGSFMTVAAIIFGAALTMKVQYYLIDEQGLFGALRLALGDLRLLPRRSPS